jgi:WD40 repeat protein
VNLQQAERAIRNAWIAGVVSLVLTLRSIIFMQFYHPSSPIKYKFFLYAAYFLNRELRIWWCPIALMDIELILIILCIVMIIKKNIFFSLFLFILFCLDRIFFLFMWYMTGGLSFSTYWIITFTISAIFAYFFFQGFRGTMAYHRLKATTFSPMRTPRRKAAWVIVLLIAVAGLIYANLSWFMGIANLIYYRKPYVQYATFSPDGKVIASPGGVDGSIILWDVETRQPLGPPLKGHKHGVNSVAFSPDGKLLASGGHDKTIILWDVKTRQPLGPPLKGHKRGVNSVSFSLDGKLLASADGGPEFILLWDVETRQPVGKPLGGHKGAVRSVAFGPDGKFLASAGGGPEFIMLWDMGTEPPLGKPLKGHEAFANSVTFSPDGKTLASAGGDSKIILWDLETGQSLGPPLKGQEGGVHSVVFSPDGKTLASSGFLTIVLWKVETRQPLGLPLKGHKDNVWSIAFSPDGKLLASAGGVDGSIMLWDVETRKPLGSPLKIPRWWSWWGF